MAHEVAASQDNGGVGCVIAQIALGGEVLEGLVCDDHAVVVEVTDARRVAVAVDVALATVDSTIHHVEFSCAYIGFVR